MTRAQLTRLSSLSHPAPDRLASPGALRRGAERRDDRALEIRDEGEACVRNHVHLVEHIVRPEPVGVPA